MVPSNGNLFMILVSCYQMGAAETTFEDVQNIFDTGSVRGLAGDLAEKIPKITIRSNDNADASGEKVSCSVCLQVRLDRYFFFKNQVTQQAYSIDI